MTDDDHKPQSGSSGLLGVIKLITASVIILVAGLALLVVLEVIPGDVFGEFTKKALLVASIIMLASAAIALLMRGNK